MASVKRTPHDLATFISTMASDLSMVDHDELDQGINEALGQLGIFAGADRSYLFLLRNNHRIMDNTHEWCAPGIEPQIENLQDIPVDLCPWWMRKLAQNETIHVPRVADMPAEAALEKEAMEAQDILSLLVVPMYNDRVLKGFLGFDAVSREKKWTEQDIALLRIAATILISAITNKCLISKLKAQEELFKLLYEEAPLPYQSLDENGNILMVNEAWLDHLGYKRNEVIGQRYGNFIPEESHKKFQENFQQLLKTGKMSNKELPLRKADGSIIFVSYTGRVSSDRPEMVRTHCIFYDITKQMAIEDKLRRDQNKLEQIAQERTTILENTVTTLRREKMNRREMEAKARQAAHLAALGTIAAGVAHEINNPNSCIMLNAPLLKDIFADLIGHLPPEAKESRFGGLDYDEVIKITPGLLTGIQDGADRIKFIVSHLKEFANQDKRDLTGTVDINQAITNGLRLTGSRLRRMGIGVNKQLGMVPRITGNEARLEQIIINLIQNAIDAMSGNGGSLDISSYYDKRQGQVIVAITDTGCGMDSNTLKRIHEPFFTTKLDRGGTGLGLATSYSIVKEHGGELEFTSEPGKGTRVEIRIKS